MHRRSDRVPKKETRRTTAVSSSSTSQFGQNQWLVDEMYQRFQEDPSVVDASWPEFLTDYSPEAAVAGGANGSDTATAEKPQGQKPAPASTSSPAPAKATKSAPAEPAAKTETKPTTKPAAKP